MRVVHRPSTRIESAPSLFAPGMAWQRAAEAWAAGEGLAVTAWAVDQRFEARGEWHVVEWNEDGARWEIRAPTQYVRVPAAPCSKSVKTSAKGDL